MIKAWCLFPDLHLKYKLKNGERWGNTQPILIAIMLTLAYSDGGLEMTILHVLTDWISIKNTEVGHIIISIYQMKKPSYSRASLKQLIQSSLTANTWVCEDWLCEALDKSLLHICRVTLETDLNENQCLPPPSSSCAIEASYLDL